MALERERVAGRFGGEKGGGGGGSSCGRLGPELTWTWADEDSDSWAQLFQVGHCSAAARQQACREQPLVGQDNQPSSVQQGRCDSDGSVTWTAQQVCLLTALLHRRGHGAAAPKSLAGISAFPSQPGSVQVSPAGPSPPESAGQ